MHVFIIFQNRSDNFNIAEHAQFWFEAQFLLNEVLFFSASPLPHLIEEKLLAFLHHRLLCQVVMKIYKL